MFWRTIRHQMSKSETSLKLDSDYDPSREDEYLAQGKAAHDAVGKAIESYKHVSCKHMDEYYIEIGYQLEKELDSALRESA